MQSTTTLSRGVFIRPPTEIDLPAGSTLKVIKPLYGIPEAGNHWYYTYQKHHVEKLKMTPSTYDPCLLYTNSNGHGVVGLQTDDTLFLADEIFAENEEKELKLAMFAAKDREMLTNSTPKFQWQPYLHKQ